MVLYNPLAGHDLELIDSVDKGDPEGFAILAVWGDPLTGQLYYAVSAGCNCCETPFVEVSKRSDLVQIHSLKEFTDYTQDWAGRIYGYADAAKVYTDLGALMIRVRNFVEAHDILPDVEDLNVEPNVIENDEN